ncbi:MAG: Imm27 family immunity protein [Acidobacteriota bacterium]
MIEKPGPNETDIEGKWIDVNGEIVGDPARNRIDRLTSEYLQKLGKDATGWDTLYRDPTDGRLWEEIYRSGHMHGGGPPSLFNISEAKAKEKYPTLFKVSEK